MKYRYFLTFLLFVIFISCDQKPEEKVAKKESQYQWTIKEATEQAQKFNDSATWELETLNMEIEYLSKDAVSDFPLNPSPFPTPTYDSPGNGNGSIQMEIAGKNILGHYAIIGRSNYSEHLFTNPDDQYVTYFTIHTISDDNNTPSPVSASSRNHPHYFSQGSLNTGSSSRVDWVALQLANGNAYAIVNGRIFELLAGRVVLVAPQKDGSIRFYQTSAESLNSAERENYLEALKKEDHIMSFFGNSGNI